MSHMIIAPSSSIHIQGDSGGICNTLGNDSMCDSKQKSSYEHVNCILRVMYSTWRLIICVALFLPADSPTQLQSSVRILTLGRYLRNEGVGGYLPGYKLIVVQRRGAVAIV